MKQEKYIQFLGTGGGDYHAPGSCNEAAAARLAKQGITLAYDGMALEF